MILVGLALIVGLVALAHAARERWFPAPVEWSPADELAAMEVARTLGVELEEARLAVIAWRS